MGQGTWLLVFRRYLIWTANANLLWEIAHLPLYTLWETGTPTVIVWFLIRCTVGDILIILSSLVLALMLLNRADWPARGYSRVAGLALTLGLAYTLFSEWYNTEVRGLWAYSDLMPIIPLTGIGLSPAAQWIAIPLTGFWWAPRTVPTQADLSEPAFINPQRG